MQSKLGLCRGKPNITGGCASLGLECPSGDIPPGPRWHGRGGLDALHLLLVGDFDLHRAVEPLLVEAPQPNRQEFATGRQRFPECLARAAFSNRPRPGGDAEQTKSPGRSHGQARPALWGPAQFAAPGLLVVPRRKSTSSTNGYRVNADVAYGHLPFLTWPVSPPVVDTAQVWLGSGRTQCPKAPFQRDGPRIARTLHEDESSRRSFSTAARPALRPPCSGARAASSSAWSATASDIRRHCSTPSCIALCMPCVTRSIPCGMLQASPSIVA